MATLVDVVEGLTDWLNADVCPQIRLLMPDDDNMDESYRNRRVVPKAYPLFSPYGDDSPEYAIPGTPGIVVAILEGADKPKAGTRTLTVQLQLISWAPGAYGSDLLRVKKDPAAPLGRKYFCTDPAKGQTYERTKIGWKDSYNFLDLVLREIEKTEFIKGTRIKIKDGSINYGHFRTDTGPMDLYPYWINYVTFDVEAGNLVVSKTYQHLL